MGSEQPKARLREANPERAEKDGAEPNAADQGCGVQVAEDLRVFLEYCLKRRPRGKGQTEEVDKKQLGEGRR